VGKLTLHGEASLFLLGYSTYISGWGGGFIVPAGAINLQGWGSLFVWEYSTCLTGVRGHCSYG
jgi:hypothetical protein